jgi:glycosyltransferase involved in cell wall biosynthesis
MRILFICTENYAGMLPFGVNIINAFDEGELSCILVSSKKSDYRGNLDTTYPKEVHIIDQPESKGKEMLYKALPFQLFRKVQEVTRNKKFDIIHLLTEDTDMAYFINMLKKKGHVIYTVHDLVPHEAKVRSIFHKLKRKILIEYRFGLLLKNINNLAACNKIQYQALKEKFPGKNIFYHSFPSLITHKIKTGNLEVPEIKGLKNYILFFGRVEKYKGVEVLYQAYTNAPELQQYPLVIAGSGFLYFERDSSKEQNVVFINRYIHEEEIPHLFKESICTVYPYISATQSGVTSLSFYFNKPIVASSIPFFATELKNQPRCFLFQTEDGDSLTTVLRECLQQETTALPPNNTFVEPDIKQELLDIYTSIINNKGKHDV